MGFEPFQKKARPLIPKEAKIEDYALPPVSESSAPSYGKIKTSFSQNLSMTDRRFMLSELVANEMSVEKEEQERFDRKVREAVTLQLKAFEEDERKKGFELGHTQGTEKAYNEEKARIAKQLEALSTSVDSLVQAKGQLAAQYEKALVDMAFRLAKIVVVHEITERPEIIASTVTDILVRISKEDDVLVRLSSEEFEAIEAIQQEVKNLSRSGRVSFEVDQQLSQGSCVVESMSGEIATDIETRFKKLQSEIMSNIKSKQRKVQSA
jgi:flagellar biosynthesis/type III secretory pathway protein FliH